ncbi:MAG TPA: hypothetical protein VLL50_09630 [Usitatibacter sp.]|nr:hypothetical protein [Usitatibacter sp.]
MRDRPAFHEMEPPAVETSAIDGMTDEEWASRNERRAALYRRVFGTIIGIAFGILFGTFAASRLDPMARFYGVAILLVYGGCILLFVTLFVSSRESEAANWALWVIAPELAVLRSIPWWISLSLGLAAVGGVVLVAATVLVGHLPWPLR